MKYRELGRTGLMVGEIGLGCEGFVDHDGALIDELLDCAQEAGVNCLDLYSPQPDIRSMLGRSLRGRRDKFILQAQLCTAWKNGQYERTRDIEEVRASFEDLLARLECKSVEIGMIHYVDSSEDWRSVAGGELMEYARALKADGKISAVGMSSHNPTVSLEAVKSGMIDVLMFSVNPCYDLQPGDEDCEKLWSEESYSGLLVNMDAERRELYEYCQANGVAITVMKAFGGGDLLDAARSPAGAALTPWQCLHYALTRPAVATVLSGAHTVEELKISLAYESASDEERDYAKALSSFPGISWKGHCMYCGHCAPCPVGIDVAAVTKFLNLAKAREGVPETVREHYALLPRSASDCTGCGGCESRCPFEVPVRENMRAAKELFGS
ncbi:MAG: aldo/keto reductase [Synergistaceae bacterium]|nr:aldo/keto reductase [Synergistaceae bacterium]